MKNHFCAVIAALLSVGSTAQAQLTTGTLSGSVRDGQAAAVVGATASLLSEGRGTRLPSVISSANGDFVIPNIPPGTYTLEVSLKGLKPCVDWGWRLVPATRAAWAFLRSKWAR